MKINNLTDNSNLLEQCLSNVPKENKEEISECFFKFRNQKTNINLNSGASFGHMKDSYMSCNSTICLLYTSPSPRDLSTSRMPSSA